MLNSEGKAHHWRHDKNGTRLYVPVPKVWPDPFACIIQYSTSISRQYVNLSQEGLIARGFILYYSVLALRLFTPPQISITMGGHLAAQAVANAAAAVAFAFVVRVRMASYIPTSLRLGAGCGISMLVGVLGMRSMGLLKSNSFTLEAFTWQIVSDQ